MRVCAFYEEDSLPRMLSFAFVRLVRNQLPPVELPYLLNDSFTYNLRDLREDKCLVGSCYALQSGYQAQS